MCCGSHKRTKKKRKRKKEKEKREPKEANEEEKNVAEPLAVTSRFDRRDKFQTDRDSEDSFWLVGWLINQMFKSKKFV